MKTGKVYFLSAPGRIKIGFTTQPEVRFAHLKAVDMERLDVIGTADGSRDDESGLHRRLEQHQLRGEWFADNEEVRETISLFLEGKLKFAQRRRSNRELSEPDIDVSVQVVRAALAELQSVGDEIMARASQRERSDDLLRIVKFLSEQVVAPLLHRNPVEIAPEIKGN